jgi:nitrogen fixation NifU-like protein
MAYSNKVIDHYENPRTSARCRKKIRTWAPDCRRARVRRRHEAAGEGEPRHRRHRRREVQDRSGCGSAIASSSLPTEWLKGKTVDEALAIKNTDIVTELSLPPVKIHCSVLAEDAIKAAIADYKKKQGTSPRRVRTARPADGLEEKLKAESAK